MSENNILGVVLAGGKSKRFGEDKSEIKEDSIASSLQQMVEEGRSAETRADKSDLKENVPVFIIGHNEVSIYIPWLGLTKFSIHQSVTFGVFEAILRSGPNHGLT